MKEAAVVMNATVVKYDDPKKDQKANSTLGEVKGPLGGEAGKGHEGDPNSGGG